MSRRSETLVAFALAVGAGLVILVTFRRGMTFSLDAWHYWQASVSLLHGGGYADLRGEPIRAWPPLFPLVLAGWQKVFGVSIASVTFATAALVAAATLAWHALFGWLARVHGRGPTDALVATGLVAVMLVRHTRGLLSESLWHVVVPLVLLAAMRGARGSSWGLVLTLSGLCIGLLTRTVSIALAPGVAALWFAFGTRERAFRWWAPGVALAVTGLLSLGIEAVLHEGESGRLVGFRFGRQSMWGYTVEAMRGLGRNHGNELLGLGLLAWLGWGARRAELVRHVLVFVAVSLGVLIVLFSLTPVADPLRGRFTVYATMLGFGFGLLFVRGSVAPWLRWVLLALVFGVPAAGVVKYAALGRGPSTGDGREDAFREFAPRHATIGKRHVDRPPVAEEGRLWISPPRSR